MQVSICTACDQAAASAQLGGLLAKGLGLALPLALPPHDFSSTAAGSDAVIQLVSPATLADALAQLASLASLNPACPVIVVAQHLDAEQLGALLRAGAADFVDQHDAAQQLVLRLRRLLGHFAGPRVACGVLPELPGLIGQSPVFAEQVAKLPMLARYDVGVLILGETGSGKEVFAQAAHYLSPRAHRPWVAVNCGAVPADLIEDELFGHVRGAYTQAHASRAGLIREAEGGTLFLDEIDALPYNAQVKLLRFLQDKEYRPVGSNQVAHADVRVFAASNQALGELAARGEFRQDLFFRLNVITLHLPPLRERTADIAPLALHFLANAARQWQRPALSLSAGALRVLLAHRWPGNVRELKNVMDRATLLACGDVLTAEHIELDGEIRKAEAVAVAQDSSLRAAKARIVEGFERAYIEQLLASSGGNVTRAAGAAQKNRRAFFELMRKYQIEPDRFRPG